MQPSDGSGTIFRLQRIILRVQTIPGGSALVAYEKAPVCRAVRGTRCGTLAEGGELAEAGPRLYLQDLFSRAGPSA